LRGAAPFTGTAVERIHNLSGGVPRLINLLCDAALTAGCEARKRVVDPPFVERAAEEVLSVVKPPTAPQVPSPTPLDGGAPVDRKSAFHRPASVPSGEAQSEGKVPASVASWAAGSGQIAQAASAGASASAGSASGKTSVAEQEPPDQRTARVDGERSKSTFDVLISALKQNRATVRR